jgi:TonB family protein
MKFLRPLFVPILCLLAVPPSFGWGSKGHTMINRLAAESLPADVPAFLRTPEAINEIAWLGPEPDRWRSRAEPELVAAQAPDHFIDIEYADLIGPLPRQRYQYIAALYAYAAAHPDLAAELRPERVGFQPYITSEVWERLKSAMRDYRQLSAEHQDTKPVEAAILFYAGWLGHYVADGSQPLHVTINYNGWAAKENPNGYTTEHSIHSQFETTFVDAAINTSDVQPLIAPVHPIGDEWDNYLAYLRHSNSLVERVYQLDKDHGFDGTGTPAAKQFTAERLAAAASMLRDLYVAAWIKSAEPVPDWHDQHENSVPKSSGMAEPPPGVTFEKQLVVGPPPITNTSVESQQPSDAQIFRKPFPDGFEHPILRYAPDPEYSMKARKNKITGKVVVRMTVETNGSVEDVYVVSSDSQDLVDGALNAVRQYKFSPAMYQGHPVAAEINVEVNFQLN